MRNKILIPKGAKISNQDKIKLAEHSNHHSNSHIASMRRNILMGMSFNQAHREAVKKGFK